MAHIDRSTMPQLAIDPAKRPKYSKEQLSTYFNRIDLPNKYLASPVLQDPELATTKKDGLPFLIALQRYHLAGVPFENLELHYSKHGTISLHMDDLYTKFVTLGLQHGRGGRCMEHNGFFGTVLRSVGYDVRNCGGRVSRSMSPNHETRELQGATYDCWNHMLNLVRLDDQLYVVDVGMGAMGPNIIYPLVDGFETEAIPPRRIRLQKRVIPEHGALNERDAPKLWCYDVCHHPDQEGRENTWIPTYCFTEMEFLPQDYEMMSWYTSTNPRSFFTYFILCTKSLIGGDVPELDELAADPGRGGVIGDITLFNNGIRKTVGGHRKGVGEELKTEEERVTALKQYFNVGLTDEERTSIKEAVRLS